MPNSSTLSSFVIARALRRLSPAKLRATKTMRRGPLKFVLPVAPRLDDALEVVVLLLLCRTAHTESRHARCVGRHSRRVAPDHEMKHRSGRRRALNLVCTAQSSP